MHPAFNQTPCYNVKNAFILVLIAFSWMQIPTFSSKCITYPVFQWHLLVMQLNNSVTKCIQLFIKNLAIMSKMLSFKSLLPSIESKYPHFPQRALHILFFDMIPFVMQLNNSVTKCTQLFMKYLAIMSKMLASSSDYLQLSPNTSFFRKSTTCCVF